MPNVKRASNFTAILLQAYGTVTYDPFTDTWQPPRRSPWVRVVFRCQLVLMILGAYAYGDHVHDERAFVLRCRRLSCLTTPQIWSVT